MNAETDLMVKHSHDAIARVEWAVTGDAEYKREHPHHANHPSRVYYNRMMGLSDDGLRVIGAQCSDLPGGALHKEAAANR